MISFKMLLLVIKEIGSGTFQKSSFIQSQKILDWNDEGNSDF